MIINSFLEALDLEKLKPKIKRAIIEQKKREKRGKWVKVKDGIGNLHIFKEDKP